MAHGRERDLSRVRVWPTEEKGTLRGCGSDGLSDVFTFTVTGRESENEVDLYSSETDRSKPVERGRVLRLSERTGCHTRGGGRTDDTL